MQATPDDMLEALRRVTAAQAAYIQLVVAGTRTDAHIPEQPRYTAPATRPSYTEPSQRLSVTRSVGL